MFGFPNTSCRLAEPASHRAGCVTAPLSSLMDFELLPGQNARYWYLSTSLCPEIGTHVPYDRVHEYSMYLIYGKAEYPDFRSRAHSGYPGISLSRARRFPDLARLAPQGSPPSFPHTHTLSAPSRTARVGCFFFSHPPSFTNNLCLYLFTPEVDNFPLNFPHPLWVRERVVPPTLRVLEHHGAGLGPLANRRRWISVSGP